MTDKELFNQMLEELKALRAEKKITLQSISEKSRIRLKYLQALEEGALDQLPAVYDRFIFKTYLNALNVEEPEKYLAAFDAIRKPKQKSTAIFSAKNKGSSARAHGPKEWISKPLLLKIIYGGIPVLITLSLIAFLFKNQNRTPVVHKPVKELTAQQIVHEVTQAEQQSESSEETKSTVKQDTLLKIFIKATADSWMRYVKDHKDTSDFILKDGNVRTVFADSVVEFRIGNPAGIKMEINSVAYDSLAKPGQVISYMKVTPKGIVKLRAVFPKKRKVVANDSTSTI